MKAMIGDMIEIYRGLRGGWNNHIEEVTKEGQSRQERYELRHNC